MRSRPRTVFLAAVASLSSSLPPLAGAEGPPALGDRLRSIAAALRDGDAPSLHSAFVTEGKVRLQIAGLTEGQVSYGPGQVRTIFDKIFEGHRTRSFRFDEEDVSVTTPGTAFARGLWQRQSRTTGALSRQVLTFTLRLDERSWRILEIRSSRPQP